MADDNSNSVVEWIYNLVLMAMTFVALIIYLVYYIANNAHPEDTAFGKSAYAKIIIFIGYFLGYALTLIVQFDIYLSTHGINISIVYYILQWAQLVYVFTVGPALLVFYESNEQYPFMKRVFSAIWVQLPILLTMIILISISYWGTDTYTIPPQTCVNYSIVPNASCEYKGASSPCYVDTMDFVSACYTVLAWLGMGIFAVFGSVGMIVLPYDILGEFIYRPKVISEEEFKKRMKVLLPRNLKLREQGKKIEEQHSLVAEIKGITGFIKRYQFGQTMRLWECQALSLEVEFKKLRAQQDTSSMESVFYWGCLALFVLAAFVSGNYYFLLLLKFMTQVIPSFEGSEYNWMNTVSTDVLQSNGTDLTFLVNWMFIGFAFYGQIATQKGNSYFGYRSGAFTFYAITPNETQFNSFLFNACLTNVVCIAVVLLTVLNLPGYTANSQIGALMAKVYGSSAFGRIAGVSFFFYIFLLMSLVAIVGLVMKGTSRIRYADEYARLGQKQQEQKQKEDDSSDEETLFK